LMLVSLGTAALVFVFGETFSAVGWLWWLVDAARMPGLVRAYNSGLAIKILHELPLEAKTRSGADPAIEPKPHGAREPAAARASQARGAREPAAPPMPHGARTLGAAPRTYGLQAPPTEPKTFGRRLPGTAR
jgi:hypothetical protein